MKLFGSVYSLKNSFVHKKAHNRKINSFLVYHLIHNLENYLYVFRG